MIEIKSRHSIDVFFVLCVFLICAVSLLGMLFIGIRTQKKINLNTEDNFDMRTSLLYISNKAKHFNEVGKISVGNLNGENILIFEEEIDNSVYTTKVYMYNGHLMELFTEKDYEISLDAGSVITEIESFEVKVLKDGLVEILVESLQGKKSSVFISNF